MTNNTQTHNTDNLKDQQHIKKLVKCHEIRQKNGTVTITNGTHLSLSVTEIFLMANLKTLEMKISTLPNRNP